MKSFLNKTDDEKHMHDGHRGRLFELASISGLEGLSDVQLLELILCYIFPRGDVNPLAHRLLNKFDDVPTALEAPIDQLVKVKGMGEMSSKKLHILLNIFEEYTIRKLQNKKVIATTVEFLDYLEELLRFKKNEELHIFGVNNSGEVIKSAMFSKGNNDTVAFNLSEILNYTRINNVNAVILAHNHPNGSCMASEIDEKSYEELKNALLVNGCLLLDSYVLGKNGIYSMKKKQCDRIFDVTLEFINSRMNNYDN